MTQTTPETNTLDFRDTETFREQISTMLALDDEHTFAQSSLAFINEQLAQLNQHTPRKTISPLSAKHDGYIHPESTIKQAAFSKGFRLDDIDMYAALFTTMKDFRDAPGWEWNLDDPQQYRKLALFSTQYAVLRYFEDTSTQTDSHLNRNDLVHEVGDISAGSGFEPRSIADYKGRGLCAEQAAVANNMLAVLGFETSYVIGDLAIDDKKPESHAFLVLKNARGDRLIYDPMHPEMSSYDSNRTLTPFLAPGGDDFMKGESVTVTHRNSDLTEGNQAQTVSQYTYTPNMLLAAFKQA